MTELEEPVHYWTHYLSKYECVICHNREFQLFYGNNPIGKEHRHKFIKFGCGMMMALCTEHYRESKDMKL